MHPGRAFIALLGLATLAFPTQAAPLNPDQNQSPGPPAVDGDRILPGPPVARSKAAAVLADHNHNRLSDGLEAMLATLGPSESIDVIVTFSGPGNAAAAVRESQRRIPLQPRLSHLRRQLSGRRPRL